jgi:hypothetical protein
MSDDDLSLDELDDLVIEWIVPLKWAARVTTRAGAHVRFFLGPRALRRAYLWCERFDWQLGRPA